MHSKTSTLTFVVLLSISVTLLAGCERMSDLVSTPDTATTPTLKIGVIQSPEYYSAFADGAEVARTQINQSGGLLGMQVEFIVRDNQPAPGMPPTPEKSIALAKALIEDEGVIALLGPSFTTNTVQVGPVVQALQRPMIPAAAGASANAAGDFIFLAVAPSTFQAKVIADFALDSEGLTAQTAATIYQEHDVYSEDHIQSFQKIFPALGGTIVANEVYQGGDTTFSEQLARIQAANPDVIFLSSFAPEVSLVIKEARDMGIEATFIGGGSWDEPDKLLGTLDDNTPLEGIYFATNFSAEMPSEAAKQFIDAHTAMFGSTPDGIAASGYDAMLLLANAIKQANSTDPVAIRDALAGTTDFKGATYISHYDENRHPVKSMAIQTIRDGKIQTYKLVEP